VYSPAGTFRLLSAPKVEIVVVPVTLVVHARPPVVAFSLEFAARGDSRKR